MLHHLLYDCGCIYLSQYIDDSSIVHSDNLAEATASHEKIKKIITDHGFALNQDKECPPARKQKILGFFIDTEKMKIFCDPKKYIRLHEALYHMQGRVLPVKTLASVLGKLISLGPALKFPIQPFLFRTIRFLSSIIGDSNKEDWDVNITTPISILQELTFVTNSLTFWSGRSIDFIKEVNTFNKEDLDSPNIKDVQVFAGDAGKDAVCVYNVRRKFRFRHLLFDLGTKQKSSNYRELQALVLLKDSNLLSDHSHVIYITDSSSLVSWVRYGTTDKYAATTLQDIYMDFHRRNIMLSAAWIPRSEPEIELADLTIRFSSDEFCLPPRLMKKILHGKSEPTLDVFASIEQHITPKYYTRYPALGSAGSPGELCPWKDEVLWIFPPKSYILAAIRRLINEDGIKGHLVIIGKAQNAVKRFLLPDRRHLPDYVVSFANYVTKFRSTTLESPFLKKRHLLHVLEFDKTQTNTNLQSRCFSHHCDVCGGNAKAFYTF